MFSTETETSVPLLVSTKKVTANWKPWPSKNNSRNKRWTTWRYMWRFYSIEPRICLTCQREKMLKKFQKHNYLQRRTLADLWQGVRHQFHAKLSPSFELFWNSHSKYTLVSPWLCMSTVNKFLRLCNVMSFKAIHDINHKATIAIKNPQDR